jgi:hypothetical protein
MKCMKSKPHLWGKWKWPVSDGSQYRECLRAGCLATQVRIKGKVLRKARGS